MAATTIPDTASEHARLDALRRYAILDTAPEKEFDELVQRAVRDSGYPIALISLMDANRCWFKATAGLSAEDRPLRQLPREQTFCNQSFRSSGIFVVNDAREDERFRRMSVVDRPGGYRAYVGAQLITPDGYSIGTMCLLDTKPRSPTPAQMDALRALATRVMALLEARQRDLAPAPSISLTPQTSPATPIQIAPPTLANQATRDLVLIVDDEELIRGVTAAMVTRFGCETRMAADGQEALERIAVLGDRVRLVITDIHMPGMNGLELIRALRRQARSPEIAAMSGKFTPEIKQQLQDARVTYLIAKPFGMAEIQAALKATLPSRR